MQESPPTSSALTTQEPISSPKRRISLRFYFYSGKRSQSGDEQLLGEHDWTSTMRTTSGRKTWHRFSPMRSPGTLSLKKIIPASASLSLSFAIIAPLAPFSVRHDAANTHCSSSVEAGEKRTQSKEKRENVLLISNQASRQDRTSLNHVVHGYISITEDTVLRESVTVFKQGRVIVFRG